MSEIALVRRLFDHARWANRAVVDGLVARQHIPDEASELLAHVLGAELVWLDRIEGVEQSVAVWPPSERQELLEMARRSEQRYGSFLDGLTDDDLARQVSYTNSAGRELDSRLGDILLHVALHGAYHRGQVARLLRRGGFEPVPTDYIAFVRGVRAATRQDAAAGSERE